MGEYIAPYIVYLYCKSFIDINNNNNNNCIIITISIY